MLIHCDLALIDNVEDATQLVLGLDSLDTGPETVLVDSSGTGWNDVGGILALLCLRRRGADSNDPQLTVRQLVETLQPEFTVCELTARPAHRVGGPALGEFYD